MTRLSKTLVEGFRLLIPLAILAGGVLTFAAVTSRRKLPAPVERKEAVPLVATAAVQVHSDGLELNVDGIVVPHRDVTLSSEVKGRITRKVSDCRAGRFVKAGELLVEIDPRSYELEVERLKQEVEQAESALKELDVEILNSESLLELTKEEAGLRKLDLDRYVNLRQQGATSETLLNDARRMELSARSSLTTLQNQLRTLETSRVRLIGARDLQQTRLEQAELDVEKSQVRSPIDGVVVSESVEENCFVQPGAVLCVIEDTSAAEVRCSLRAEELEWIWRQAGEADRDQSLGPEEDYHLPQTPVTVAYRSGDREYQWEGILWRYEGIGLDERTRTVPCRVLVKEPRKIQIVTSERYSLAGGPRALVRGMFVDLRIRTRPNVRLLSIPEQAVQPGKTVYVVRDGKLEIVKLRNTTISGGHVLVPDQGDGVHAGDRLVVTPLNSVSDGMPVRVSEESATAPLVDAASLEERR